MAKIGLPKGSEKRLKVSEKSGIFEMDIEWQPCGSKFFPLREVPILKRDAIERITA